MAHLLTHLLIQQTLTHDLSVLGPCEMLAGHRRASLQVPPGPFLVTPKPDSVLLTVVLTSHYLLAFLSPHTTSSVLEGKPWPWASQDPLWSSYLPHPLASLIPAPVILYGVFHKLMHLLF